MKPSMFEPGLIFTVMAIIASIAAGESSHLARIGTVFFSLAAIVLPILAPIEDHGHALSRHPQPNKQENQQP